MSRPPSSLASSILFENAERTIVVIDLPRSIEEAQEVTGVPAERKRLRLLSAPAPAEPFTTPPGLRSFEATHNVSYSLAAQLAELTTQAAAEGALRELQAVGFDGPWCLPRYLHGGTSLDRGDVQIPPGARYLAGTIAACRGEYLAEAPQFDLIVLDPPWPNRSARRRRRGRTRKSGAPYGGDGKAVSRGDDSGYATAADMEALREMLEQIPVGAKLATAGVGGGSGVVAVWVTNKPACEELLTDPKHGVFRAWGVELVATWAWLKVTARGEPVVSVGSGWRKPWERLLLARIPGGDVTGGGGGGGGGSNGNTHPALPSYRVIIGVPDVHSRKPNLRPLLAPFLSPSAAGGDHRNLIGLEVFARNLTAGWWAWGDEVLLFQHSTWWVVEGDAVDNDLQEPTDSVK